MRYACTMMLLAFAVTTCGATAWETELATWQPLWPGGIKDNPIVHDIPELIRDREKKQDGEPYHASLVSEPKYKVFPAQKDSATRAAVVVFPGGGYRFVSVGPEGYTVAKRLNSLGITAVVVKYRTMPVDPNGNVDASDGAWERKWPAILADAKRAMRTVRSRAAELGVDPNKIGTAGFSAGGHLTAALMLDTDAGAPDSNDPVEKVSCRPDFTCMIYPGFSDEMFEKVKPGIGPCFIAIAANDTKCPPEACGRMFEALQRAQVPSEIHFYQSGGHGFNVGKTRGTESTWPDVFAVWLRQNGFARN